MFTSGEKSNNFKFEINRDGNQKNILPENFEIPDLSFLNSSDYAPNAPEEFSFDFKYGGQDYRGKVLFVRVRKSEISPNILAKIEFDIEAYESDGSEKASGFHFIINKGPTVRKYEDTDGATYCCSNINYRYVEPDYRGRGLAELSMDTIEEITKRIATKYPEWQLDFLEVYTRLVSITKLLVDKEWLAENGLKEYQRSGKNMGYSPDEQDFERVRDILKAGLSRLEDGGGEGLSDIRLVKRIDR